MRFVLAGEGASPPRALSVCDEQGKNKMKSPALPDRVGAGATEGRAPKVV